MNTVFHNVVSCCSRSMELLLDMIRHDICTQVDRVKVDIQQVNIKCKGVIEEKVKEGVAYSVHFAARKITSTNDHG